MSLSFNKLVQNKRTKMLILSIFLTIVILTRESTSINLTYIVKKEGKKLQPNCIAEENERYAAIGWIYPLATNQEPKITTKFLPTVQNEYNCKFSKNDKCNKIWTLKNWEIDENSTRTLDLLFDSRWEDFPTLFTSNNVKEFQERIEIPNIFQSGVSIRASDSIEILLCEGWNPYNYPCYHFNITTTTISLRKFMTLPKNISLSNEKFLDSYKAFANILSSDEWRNFIINLDKKGTLTLLDVNVNRTVIQHQDKQPLKPLYLLIRSEKPALWKLHQNQFIYTKTPQLSRLGPILNLQSKEMCVSFYISTCPTCSMRFLMVKENEKRILADVEPTENYQWRLVKLKEDHILVDKLTLFVETRFSDGSNQTEGFWAVDDIRVCHENEVKVTFLKYDDEIENEDGISCQVVKHPKWRPKKLVYPKIQDFPIINSTTNSTSISLNWTQEDSNNQINYFITYKANDRCPPKNPNLKRIKSNGFLMTKHNEITINNLIPYTIYNITFSSMLHENPKEITATTIETELPTMEELPTRLNIHVTENQAFASWDEIPCASIYGPLLYLVEVTNRKTNLTRKVNEQAETTITINNLDPFTLYILNITTGRYLENLENRKNTIFITSTFTTRAGVSPPVENLELYSIDKNSVSFRYNLPKSSKGIPIFIQVTRCNALSFKKCKTLQAPITPCSLWKTKYCLDLPNLIPLQKYTFRVSLRNDGTQLYGEETVVEAFMDDRVPGAPTIINYKMVECDQHVDYCHLNISWAHPYDQNGTITSFHIVLNATDNNTTKDIQEVFKIFNSSYYQPNYEYQIKFIPYSTHYELYIQSVNSKYKSVYAQKHVKTDDLGDHIYQNPTLLKSEPYSLTFLLPSLDPRLKSYSLQTIIQDFNTDKLLPFEITKNQQIRDHLCHNFGDTWVLDSIEVTTNSNETFDIGTGIERNKYLKPKTQYCIVFVVTNTYRNSQHFVVYEKKITTPETGVVYHTKFLEPKESVAKSSFNGLYLLFLLLLLIPIGYIAYRYFKRRRLTRTRQENNKENVYESLPFEECEATCVNNDTYDHLLHK